MRRSAFVMLIAGSIASLTGAAARAQDSPGALGRPSTLSGRPSPGMLERYDTNRDGTLDVAERAAMRQDVLQRMKPLRDAALRQYDWNKNGLLEDDERQAMNQARQMRHEQVEAWALKRYDANRNGVLDPAEQEVRKATREEWLRQKKSQILETFDANRNGTLDPAEKAVIRQKSEAAHQAALDLYDSNRDGRLDDAERANALGTSIAPRTRREATAGASGGRAGEPGAPGAETSAAREGAAGPALSGLRVSPPGGSSYAQGAEIAFTLGRPGSVSVRIHDAAGRLVRTLASGAQTDAGPQALRWDGTGSSGRAVSNGLYLVTVEAFGSKATRKVAFIR